MRIKKHHNGNEYFLTQQNMWVRNFTKQMVPYLDLNKTISVQDQFPILENEIINNRQRYPWIDTEDFTHRKIIIVSDGYDFKNKQHLLANCPKDVVLMGVHGALHNWNLKGRSLNYYIVNNPYQECLNYLPKRGFGYPRCIASTRTNYKFMANYRGTKYRYCPVADASYAGTNSQEIDYKIDDYRNAICAAINLAYRFGVEKLLLFCCDDSFADERPGALSLANKLWTYPQQLTSHGLIDANLHWLKQNSHQEVQIKDHSQGDLYKSAEYITENDLVSFFEMEPHG